MRKKQTTILHLLPDLEQTVEARTVVDLALLTHRHGLRPLIASAGGALVMEAERSAIRHTRAPLNRKNLFARWLTNKRLAKLARKEKPSLIHAHGPEVLPAALKLAKAQALPLLVDLNEPLEASKNHKKLLRRALALKARFCVPSAFMAAHLYNDFALNSPHLYRVAPGVDPQWYDAGRITAERIQNLSRLWRLPETTTVILTGAPMKKSYGHRLLLEALSKLKRKDIYTVMIGAAKPAFAREIEQLVTNYNLNGQVVMIDSCQDWPAACWLASTIVAVNETPRGQASEIIAGQALGRPVITTHVGANHELVKSGETAWLIPPGDLTALTTALQEVIQMSTDQRIDLGERTRNFIVENFSQKAWAGSLFEIYSAMLAEPM